MSATMHGKNLVGSEPSSSGEKTFRAYDPRAGEAVGPTFHEATEREIEQAGELAASAAVKMRKLSAEQIAEFLMAIGEEISAIGDPLIARAAQETGLDETRLIGERGRTLNQIKMFADIVKEGSWVDARIDPALPDRKPLPRPDLRRMLEPIGPVAVFGASNFPLAFSVAGGDTISAFAARNPVIVKAHPAHPGTSELVASAVLRAVEAKAMPEGTFSMLHGKTPETSLALVSHPKVRAVGFTGSERAGRALFDAAARRPEPIPVYAEMGSVNPVFILPQILRDKALNIAEGLSRSVLLGVGQFCTSPGLVFGVRQEALNAFREKVVEAFEQAIPATMLNPAIANGYGQRLELVRNAAGVEAHLAARKPNAKQTEGQPGVALTTAETWLGNKELHEEIFGPATVLIECASSDELLRAARALEGSLTATVHGTPEELAENEELIDILRQKAGRLIFNGYPTGVEVGSAMHHGGPYPATSDEKFTSVGATAIYRFARPICFQNFPQNVLPPELQDANPRNIWRTVDGRLTQDSL
jgi:alpha-ketoglutaric semialdehyde dehydrogenase